MLIDVVVCFTLSSIHDCGIEEVSVDGGINERKDELTGEWRSRQLCWVVEAVQRKRALAQHKPVKDPS